MDDDEDDEATLLDKLQKAGDSKLGKKKQAKLEAKAEKKAHREAVGCLFLCLFVSKNNMCKINTIFFYCKL